jgi:TPR repeat protein
MRKISIFGMVALIIFCATSVSFAGNTNAMIQLWKDKANQGSPTAPFQLGWSYAHGQGVKKNLAEAAKWYRLGAKRGDFQAALELANMYLDGEGVQKNEDKAVDLYVKIGKTESILAPIAQIKLLLLARKYSLGGEQVKPDKKKASAMFDKLLEIETAKMNHCKDRMDKSAKKFNDRDWRQK